MDTSRLKVCRDCRNALRSIPLLDADALVQALEEGVLEPLDEDFHFRLVADRDILRLCDTGSIEKTIAAQEQK